MRALSRFGILVIGAAVSLTVIAFLLSSRAVTTRLDSLGLSDYIWDWSNPNNTELAVVVFGDSWVDDGIVLQNEGGSFTLVGSQESSRHPLQGDSWTKVLCSQLKCTSYLNFAASAPITIESPPSGALTSNSLYKNATELPGVVKSIHDPVLPDLTTQISSYLELSSSLPPTKTLFVLSFGLWDTYHYASLALNREQTEQITTASINIIFQQLDLLFKTVAEKTENALTDEELENQKSVYEFQVVIPQLVDPTFLPGWRMSRPEPLPPTSVAEEQKTAVTLVSKWNSYLQGKITNWNQEAPAPAKATAPPDSKKSSSDEEDNADEENDKETKEKGEEEEEEADEVSPSLLWQKTIHFPALETYFLDSLRTKYLQSHKIFDANGLGTDNSPYESVSVPCAPIAGFEELKRDGRTARGRGIDATSTDSSAAISTSNGSADLKEKLDDSQQSKGSCGDAERWLFWDEWNLGPRAQREVGKNVAVVVNDGNKEKAESLKKAKAAAEK